MTYYFYQKLQKEARERYQIFLKKKQTIGEKKPERNIKVSPKKKTIIRIFLKSKH